MVATDGGVIEYKICVFSASDARAEARKFCDGSGSGAFDDFHADFARAQFDGGI